MEDTGDTITRTTASGVNRVGVDLQLLAFLVREDGGIRGYTMFFSFEYRVSGTAAWTLEVIQVTTPDGSESRKPSRHSYVFDVPENSYDVRCKVGNIFVGVSQTIQEALDDNPTLTFDASVVAFRGYQADTADFTARHPFAIRIKATGQLSGRLARINADATQRIEAWD